MCTVNEGICLLVLLVLSTIDIKKRQIPVWLIIAAGAASILYHITVGKQDLYLMLGGIVIGCFFIFISKITREGLGYGDSFGILVLGIYLGFWQMLELLTFSFFLLTFVSIPFIWKKRMNRKVRLPFYPFMAGGYLLLIFAGG